MRRLLVWVGLAAGALGEQPQARALPLALPDASHTRLVLQPEAIEWLRALRGPVALVSIIGPYRSGKSFLLNQLLSVDCDSGFAVGHRRQTQTKGVWLWSAPLPRPPADTGSDAPVPATILFLDTEGIEGAGAAGVYDDRVFSFAALLSSVLVYNVPEAVREDDIEKLAFVVELASEFFARVGGGSGGGAQPAAPAWAPPSLLWLIQRDFLQGADASEHVAATLRPVPNPSADEHVARLNQVRGSLGVFRNIDAIGLPQPALERTRLCELAAAGQLPAAYSQKLGAVSAYVAAHARPLGFGSAGGGPLADFAERALQALNAQEIPSVASVVSAFNAQLVARCAKGHADAILRLPLPTDEAALLAAHDAALAAATARLLAQSFGGNQSAAELVSLAGAALAARRDANFKASHEACARGWAHCEPLLQAARGALLPSRARLEDQLGRCNASLASCAGPAAAEYTRRAAEASARARAEVLNQFDEKLATVSVLGSLSLVAFARFALRSGLLEALGWAALFLLEVAPRLDVLGGGRRTSMLAPDSPRAKAALDYYEAAVYNSYYDGDHLLGLLPLLVVLLLLARLLLARRRRARSGESERREGLGEQRLWLRREGSGGEPNAASRSGASGLDIVIKAD